MSSSEMWTRMLPPPVHKYETSMNIQVEDESEDVATPVDTLSIKLSAPPYLQRQSFIPYNQSDFGDGGAFPEIHVVQYPLDMGRPGAKSTAVVSVDVDETGEVRYDAIVKQGANQKKKVQTSLDDVKEKKGDTDKISLPTSEEEAETTQRTQMALQMLLQGKIAKAARGTQGNMDTNKQNKDEPQYIRYTPNPDAPGYNPAAKQRVIRMVEAQVDPMEPPKHKIKKVPRGGGSPPVPVLHSPPRKLTVADQQAWKIPPCVSNWKNARGYTIPLDKRLAADGRGLQDITINNKFASLSESMYIAERKAAEDLRMRNQIRKKMAMKEKEDKEKELREMASRARMERAGVLSGSNVAENEPPSYYQRTQPADGEVEAQSIDRGRHEDRYSSDDEERSYDRDKRRDSFDSSHYRDEGENEDERIARVQREKLRNERRKERERELRLDNMKGTMRKNKIDRDDNRDVSEKIALGMHKGSGKLSGEAVYDARLFNQSSGMDSGFGAEDEYNTYSKPLFDRQEASSIYRPKRDDGDMFGDVDKQMEKLQDTSRFKADKGFRGAEGGMRAGGRTEPVQFEKMAKDDPFGIDDIVEGDRKRARKD